MSINRIKFRVKTEPEQYIWCECTQFLANCIIFCNAFFHSALLTQAEKLEEAEVIKGISPIA